MTPLPHPAAHTPTTTAYQPRNTGFLTSPAGPYRRYAVPCLTDPDSTCTCTPAAPSIEQLLLSSTSSSLLLRLLLLVLFSCSSASASASLRFASLRFALLCLILISRLALSCGPSHPPSLLPLHARPAPPTPPAPTDICLTTASRAASIPDSRISLHRHRFIPSRAAACPFSRSRSVVAQRVCLSVIPICLALR